MKRITILSSLKNFIFTIILFIPVSVYSQTIDTLQKTDTLKSVIDTSRQVKSDIDAVINYSASDSAVFDLVQKKLYLYNKSELIYKDLKLNAGVIVVNQETEILESFGLPDTAGVGSFIQTPIMLQGIDKYEGSKLSYNFQTGQGNVSMGFSDADVGYYFGEVIKKVTPEIFFIKNGLYTTSTDKKDPEYYFFSPKMKIIPKDKVIAQSVYLYIEGVPVLWIPFAVLPNRSGRSSGLITPTYGSDGTYGIYFSKIGYFWAVNDYTDLALTTSIFTKGRVDFNSRFRYNLRYFFSGSVEAGYSRIRLGSDKDIDKFSSDEWAFNLQHNQRITPTMTLSGNLSFASGKSYYENSTNSLSILLRQNIVSNLTLSKFWEETPYSMNVNYYRDQNLQNGDVTERLPSVGFNISQVFPFRSSYSGSDKLKLYEYFSLSYGGQYLNSRTKRTITGFSGLDSTYNSDRMGVQHSLSLNLSPQIKNINVNPYFNYTELWYNKYITKTFNPSDSSLSVNELNAIKSVRFFSMGVSLNTKFVGIFSPKIFGITGIRHTITPSVTYNYTPDFSVDKWGYYGKYSDAQGREVKYSYFEREIFGYPGAAENQSVGLNVGNLFEMKTKVNDTTENKFQLFNINAAINYNFAADSMKWSEFRTDFRTRIGGLLDIAGGATFNLYKYDVSKNSRVNSFLLAEGRLAEITSFNINLSTSFNFGVTNSLISTDNEKTGKDLKDYKDSKDFNDTKEYKDKKDYNDLKEKDEKDTLNTIDTLKSIVKTPIDENKVSLNIPLSGGLNFNFSESRPTPQSYYKSANISGNLAFSLTDKWKFTFATGYDLIQRQLGAPYFTAYRDLNSWEMLFNWYPIGTFRGFNLEIRIKAPELRDIKVTRQTNTRGVY